MCVREYNGVCENILVCVREFDGTGREFDGTGREFDGTGRGFDKTGRQFKLSFHDWLQQDSFPCWLHWKTKPAPTETYTEYLNQTAVL